MKYILALLFCLAIAVPVQAQGCRGGQGGGPAYYAQPTPAPACPTCPTCPTCPRSNTIQYCQPYPAVMETRSYGTPGPMPAVMETRTMGPLRADPVPTGFPVPSITISGTFSGSGSFFPTPAPQVFRSQGYRAPTYVPCPSCPGGFRYAGGYELPTPSYNPQYTNPFAGGCPSGNCPSGNCPGGYCPSCPNGQCQQPRWR